MIMTAELIPDDPDRRGANRPEEVPHEPPRATPAAPGRPTLPLLDRARERFKELASVSVAQCILTPDMSRTVLRSLELGFAQIVKEEGPVLQRQFARDVEAAVTWAAQRLLQAKRYLAADIPGQKQTQLQSLAILEVQALEMMLPESSAMPERSPANAGEPRDVTVPKGQLRSFCALLNDGLDFAQKAEMAADRRDVRAYEENYVLSRRKWRRAARTLRRLLRDAGPETSDVSIGLRGFQIELASHAGSVRMFLKALSARKLAAQARHRQIQVLEPHCLVGDLLATLFDRHFAFTIDTPRGMPAQQSQELVTAAHELMWQKIEEPVSELLAQPSELSPARFKAAVEVELRKAIADVNQHFEDQRVTISIMSNNIRAIRRRDW